ncbi:MAG: SIMPL domain-containing protein, partial [Ilumatobacteraceae bacterium]
MRRLGVIGVVIASALVLAACGETVNIGDDGVAESITVQAVGTADVVPDSVRLSLTVSVVSDSNEDALSLAASAADRVRGVLTDSGVATADIATQTVTVNPEYSYTEAEGQKIIGYRASQVFDVLIRDAEGAGAVVDAVVAAGGADVSINYTSPVVEDATASAVAARKDAVAKARAKAEEYAALLDVELGDVLYLTEVSSPNNVVIGAKADAAAESLGTTVDLGTQEVTVTVEVRWEIS